MQFKEDLPCEAIQEVQEENDISLLQTQSHPLRVRPASPEAPRFNLAEQFRKIDQSELEKIGFLDKQAFSEEAIPEVSQYSMLQRLRQGRDFSALDKPVPAQRKSPPRTGKENKWWLAQPSRAEPKQSVEKTRYVKALKVMVQDKGIPSLCICGGNGLVGKPSKGETRCASNCQFYKNEREYERVLRDILASTNV